MRESGLKVSPSSPDAIFGEHRPLLELEPAVLAGHDHRIDDARTSVCPSAELPAQEPNATVAGGAAVVLAGR